MGQAVEAEPEIDDIDSLVEDAIRQAGGARAAVRGLILGQRTYEEQLARTVSAGYVRRGLPTPQ